MKKDNLYFIALIPGEPVLTETRSLKYYFAEKYNTKAALRSPPHITLYMPFKWREDKEQQLQQSLASFARGRDPFVVELKGYGAFPPRVIFIDVERSEALQTLKTDLDQWMARDLKVLNEGKKERPFNPHLTVAFRDLKKPIFKTAWEEFQRKPFDAAFDANNLTLLRHNGQSWDVFRTFPFS